MSANIASYEARIQALETENRVLRQKVEQMTVEQQQLECTNHKKTALLQTVLREAKTAEAALIDSQRQITSMLSNLPGLFYRCQNDHNWTMSFLSEGCLALTGYPAEVLLHSEPSYVELIHPKERAALWNAVQQALEDKQPFELSYRIRTAAGQEKWVLEKGNGVWKAGELLGIEGFVIDITDRKTAERKLQKQEQHIKSLLNNLPHAAWLKDEQGRYIAVNQPFCDFCGGMQPEAIVGKTDRDVLPAELAQHCYHQDISVITSGRQQRVEEQLCLPNGQIFWSETIKTPLFDAEGYPQGTVGISMDITDRKATEAILIHQEAFLRTVYDGADSGIFVIDVLAEGSYRVEGWNLCLEQKFGRTSAAIAGRLLTDLFPPAQAEAMQERYRACVEQGQPFNYEERLILADRSIFWGMTTLSPLKDDAGRVYRLIGTVHDITARKQVEQQLQEQAQELAQTLQELQQTQAQMIQTEKMSSLGQMVAGVAHEINNPVNFIHGNLTHAEAYIRDLLALVNLYQQHYPHPVADIQLRLEELDFDFLQQDLAKLLSSMRVGTDRIRAIVLSLRNFSRLDEAEYKSVNLYEGIDSTLMILQNRFKDSPNHPAIQIVREYDPIPDVDCYPGQINQVFMNILSNAIDAMETNRAQAATGQQITIRGEAIDSDWVAIHITDNGAGMSESMQAKIFNPFFTTKPVGKGTGLGLSISYQIITERHGGQILCQSSLGEGTRFTVKIPVHQVGMPT
jgi:PAS domain S-box-containing protein